MVTQLIPNIVLAEHLRVDPDEDANVLTQCIAEASEIILNYLKLAAVPATWADTSDSPPGTGVPFDVQACVKAVAAELYFNREAAGFDPLSPSIKNLLHRRRDPALA